MFALQHGTIDQFPKVTLWAPARGDLTLCVGHCLIHSVAVAPVHIPPGAVLSAGVVSRMGMLAALKELGSSCRARMKCSSLRDKLE